MAILCAIGALCWGLHRTGPTFVEPLWVIDRSNDAELVGWAEDVFLGRVARKLGQIEECGWPDTQFEVHVLEVIKGSLSGVVTVNQQGGYRKDGSIYRVDGDIAQLDPAGCYLFVTRHLAEKGWHTLVPQYGNIKLQLPLGAGMAKKEILTSSAAETLRSRFTAAVANQMPFVP